MEMLISVDPSISALGIACFASNTGAYHKSDPFNYVSSAFIEGNLSPSREHWTHRASVMVDDVRKWAEGMLRVCAARPDHSRGVLGNDLRVSIAIEMPQVFQGQKGQGANNSGNIQKLTAVAFGVGMHIVDYLLMEKILKRLHTQIEIGDVWYITPSEWKGQASKELIHERMLKKRFKFAMRGVDKNTDHNQLDAIALGVWTLKEKYGVR